MWENPAKNPICRDLILAMYFWDAPFSHGALGIWEGGRYMERNKR